MYVENNSLCTNDKQCEFSCPVNLPYYCLSQNSCLVDEVACNAKCSNIPVNGTICEGSDINPPLVQAATVVTTCTTPTPPACEYQCLPPNPYYCVNTNTCVAGESLCDVGALTLEKLDNEDTLHSLHDDTQIVGEGGTARFLVRVKNESLSLHYQSFVLTDIESPDCSRNATRTEALTQGASKIVNTEIKAGNGDNILDPGEFFTYTCEKTGVTFSPNKTFPDDNNHITLTAKK